MHAPAMARLTLLAALAAAGCATQAPIGEAHPAPAAEGPAVATGAEQPVVEVVPHEAEQRVDVLVDGQPFTSYRWAPDLKKPLLYPLRAADGALVTRGWPVEPRPGEPTDHPHHIGFWLNYGDVNGVDFWGNSSALKPESAAKKGSIVHRAIRATRTGERGRGALSVTSEWMLPDGHAVLREETDYAFAGGPGRRAVDRIATLSAVAGPVTFADNKEGTLGLRLAHELEHPAEKNPTGTGNYHSSEGREGGAVWGTRGRWLMSTGTLDGRPITIAILDHPGNPGHPTYWHARTWGLFAANPLGQKALSGGKETLNFALAAGQSARFAYRLLILSRRATPDEIEAEYRTFVTDIK
jgi:hypothetical protein